MSDTPGDVSTPTLAYRMAAPLWGKCRAILAGEDTVKHHDTMVMSYSNFLVPFSPSMSQEQYNHLKREAELPGVCSEFRAMLVGALLRRAPDVQIDGVAEDVVTWIQDEFSSDGSPLVTYMEDLLVEELSTTYGWTFVDYDGELSYPRLFPAECIINVKLDRKNLRQVVVRTMEEEMSPDNEFHPNLVEVIYVHELVDGAYQIRRFTESPDKKTWTQTVMLPPLMDGDPLSYIPAWPNNGSYQPGQPFLLNLVNKEIALYNKLARRNHLLYNASTYTPYVIGVEDDAFKKIVNAGLGSWLQLPAEAEIGVLEAPTAALADLEKSIATGFEEMAKLGVRMLSPETSQSGVALQLRNASQSARIGTLNTRIGVIMKQIICTMINWRLKLKLKPQDIKFDLQSDFTSFSGDEAWLRLCTEWYENGLIPRSVWVRIMKSAEKLPDDYDDVEGRKEIDEAENFSKSYTEKLNAQTAAIASRSQPSAGGV